MNTLRFLTLGFVLQACANTVGPGQTPPEDAGTDTGPQVDGGPTPVEPDGGVTPIEPPTDVPTTTTPDAGQSCNRTTDRAIITLSTPDGTAESCENFRMPGPPPSVTEVRGEVHIVSDTAFTVDACPPNADCVPRFYRVSVTAPGLSVRVIPEGAFVTLSYQFVRSWACTSQLMVKNLPTWGGVASPIGTDERIYLAAADGVTTVLDPDVSFARVALGCQPSRPTCGGPAADEYALDLVMAHDDTVSRTRVLMGETASVVHFSPTVGFPLMVRNLRSYETGACDDSWNFGWWMSAVEFRPD